PPPAAPLTLSLHDALPVSDAQEIHVDGEVLDRVELVVARNHAVLGAVHIEFDDVAQEAAGIDLLVGVLVGDGDGDGSLLVTVDKDRKSTRLNSSHVKISYA